MKKVLLMVVLLLVISATARGTTVQVAGFSCSITLTSGQASVTITKVSNLVFPSQTITGSNFSVTVATGDSGAATFNATGQASQSFTRVVVDSSINMSGSSGGTIAVGTFTLAGPTAFDGSGNATGIKVGATANVLSNSVDGTYTGSATLRVTYV